MTDYRDLSEWQQVKVDREIMEEVEPKHHINSSNGFEWDEPAWTLQNVHNGWYCARCWMASHNCLCSHDS